MVGLLTAENSAQRRQMIKAVLYLHPASLSLRAYILPISPIPIIPTTKLSILE
jgi:hypothetical protein